MNSNVITDLLNYRDRNPSPAKLHTCGQLELPKETMRSLLGDNYRVTNQNNVRNGPIITTKLKK